jgi:hypothetical protein
LSFELIYLYLVYVAPFLTIDLFVSSVSLCSLI